MEERKINLPFFSPFHQTPRPTYPYTISKSLLPLHYAASPLPVLLIGDKVRWDAYARVLRYRRGNRGGRRETQPWLFGGEADKLRVSFIQVYAQENRSRLLGRNSKEREGPDAQTLTKCLNVNTIAVFLSGTVASVHSFGK